MNSWEERICPRVLRWKVGQREAAVDVSVIVEFGHRLPEVATEIQRNVKRSIETMTGLTVIEVNYIFTM